jgi:dynein heavy chain
VQGKGVEDWMTELEASMRDSVKSALYESILSYVDTKRTDWVQANYGQCVLAASQMHWTREIEVCSCCDTASSRYSCSCRTLEVSQGTHHTPLNAVPSRPRCWHPRRVQDELMHSPQSGLQVVLDRVMAQLGDMVNLVRGYLKPLARMTLSALAVLDVHSRDVTQSLCVLPPSSLLTCHVCVLT